MLEGLTLHSTVLLVLSRGSPKLSQPSVHFCVVTATEAVPTDGKNANANRNTFFITISLIGKTCFPIRGAWSVVEVSKTIDQNFLFDPKNGPPFSPEPRARQCERNFITNEEYFL